MAKEKENNVENEPQPSEKCIVIKFFEGIRPIIEVLGVIIAVAVFVVMVCNTTQTNESLGYTKESIELTREALKKTDASLEYSERQIEQTDKSIKIATDGLEKTDVSLSLTRRSNEIAWEQFLLGKEGYLLKEAEFKESIKPRLEFSPNEIDSFIRFSDDSSFKELHIPLEYHGSGTKAYYNLSFKTYALGLPCGDDVRTLTIIAYFNPKIEKEIHDYYMIPSINFVEMPVYKNIDNKIFRIPEFDFYLFVQCNYYWYLENERLSDSVFAYYRIDYDSTRNDFGDIFYVSPSEVNIIKTKSELQMVENNGKNIDELLLVYKDSTFVLPK